MSLAQTQRMVTSLYEKKNAVGFPERNCSCNHLEVGSATVSLSTKNFRLW